MFSAVQHLDATIVDRTTIFVAAHPAIRFLVYIGAEWLVLLFPLVLVALWFMPHLRGKYHHGKKAVIMAVMTLAISLSVKSGLSFFADRARPFVAHPSFLHLNINTEGSSFPSGHTIVAMSIAISLLYSGYRRLGWSLVGLAVVVAISRVAAGVHYSTDVLASIIISLVAAVCMHREASTLKHYLPNELETESHE